MVVAALALDRFQKDGGHIDRIVLKILLDLTEHTLLVSYEARSAFLGRRKCLQRCVEAWPGELWEVHVLARIGGVGDREGVPAATVKCVSEVHNLRATLAVPGGDVQAYLPVER